MKSINERVADLAADYGITEITGTDEAREREPDWSNDGCIFKLVATHRADRGQIILTVGQGHGAPRPEPVDFFDIALLAACAVTGATESADDGEGAFPAWCSELDRNPDSRRAYRNWQAGRQLTNRLALWLGSPSLFHAWLRETEGL